MKDFLTNNLTGLIGKKSTLTLATDFIYIGNKKFLSLVGTASIFPGRKKDIPKEETIHLVLYYGTDVVLEKSFKVNLLEEKEYVIDKDIEVSNVQYELQNIRLELVSDHNYINYCDIKYFLNIEPYKEVNTYIYADYFYDKNIFYIKWSTNSMSNKVFLKINDEVWKEIENTGSMELYEDELEETFNYIQFYTTDSENHKIYSNILRIVKNESPE